MILNRYEHTKIANSKLPSSWQSQNALDELSFFLQQNWEQRAVFYNDGDITSQQQFLNFVGQKGVRTNKYIGTIIFKGEQLNIFPKVFRTERDDQDTDDLNPKDLLDNLKNWIDYCNKLNYPFLNVPTAFRDTEDLKELFITLYIGYIRSTLERGGYYRYIDKTEDITTIKGKFDYKDYILNKVPSGQVDRFKCTYSTFEFDNSVNRIIKYTCKQLYNATTKRNQKELRNIFAKFNEVSDMPCTPNDCDHIRLSNLHKHYEIIISMSKMFLLNKMADYSFDNQDAFCFLFPTDLLFEGFIGGFLRDVMEKYGADVQLQESRATLVEKIIYKGAITGAAFSLRHDILVDYNNKLFVLDTKYKELSRFEDNPQYADTINSEIKQSDMYQVLEYARKRNIEDVYLLYPMYRYEEPELDFPIAVSESPKGDINVHFIRVPFIFEEDDEVKMKLTNTIKAIFEVKNDI